MASVISVQVEAAGFKPWELRNLVVEVNASLSADARRPDVTLMDLRLPDLGGLDVMMAIRSEFPDARVIILTTFERDVEIQRALRAGARGYLLKSMPPQQMFDAIRQVHAGKKYVPPEIAAGLAEHLADETLTEREVEVLRHVAKGNRNQDIADRLFIAEETVKVHLEHIMGKLCDRSHAVSDNRRPPRHYRPVVTSAPHSEPLVFFS
jgi:DNA-binding NarL/FixJ family response regulator